MAMIDTLRNLRDSYGPTMTDDECVELLNTAAWLHIREGYGLSRKEFGTRGIRYDRAECCHDVLMLQDGRYWDCIASAGGISTVHWSDTPSGVITDPRRGWLAPIEPESAPPPPPPPPEDLERRIAVLEAWRASIARVSNP